MRPSLRAMAAAITAVPLLPRTASACPFCDSSTSQLVWEGIFDDRFVSHMTMSLAPFALFAIVGVWLHGSHHRLPPGDNHEKP